MVRASPASLRHEGVQALADHRLGQRRHVRNIDQLFGKGFAHQGQSPAHDIDRNIAHALQVVVDFHARP